VKGSTWWLEVSTDKRKRSVYCPGDGWIESMGTVKRSPNAKTVKGRVWWNDGNGNTQRSVECPGNNWKRGMK